MKNFEDNISYEMAKILNDMRYNWTVSSQPLHVFKNKHKRPDILIKEDGLVNVIIENEIHPNNPEKDAKDKLDQEFKNGKKVEIVIAVQIPENFRNIDLDISEELKKTKKLNYAVYSPDRFPTNGWLTGTLHNIAKVSQIAFLSSKEIVKDVDFLNDVIDSISELIQGSGEFTKERISKLLFQKPNEQTWKMAGLILSNAFIFHSNIAGEHQIKTIRDITYLGIVNLNELNDTWDKILEINYFAIFDVAKKILNYINNDTAQNILENLQRISNRVSVSKLSRSTDMYGSLIQKTISDRKTLASFYTLPTSATLLAGLVIPNSKHMIYENEDSITKIKIADFACGTGTLLTTAYQQLIMNYEINGGNMREIHSKVIENCIIGFDVLPSAVHLTVSSLAGIFPKITIDDTKISTIGLGKNNGTYNLGSLDHILPYTTLDEQGTYIGKNKEKKYMSHEIADTSIDYIIMNPPFTSNTREGGKEGLAMFTSFDIKPDDQRKMAKLEKKIFADTCADGNAGYATHFIALADKKLVPGGTMGMVLPSTLSDGSSWSKCRELFKLKYIDVNIVSIAGSSKESEHIKNFGSDNDGSFSFDTNLNEMLIIAKKESTERIEEIDSLQKKRHIFEKNN